MFDTAFSEVSGLSDYNQGTQIPSKGTNSSGKIKGTTKLYKERVKNSLTLDQRRKEDVEAIMSLDQYQLSTLRQLIQMRLIEIMISLDQVVNPTPDTHWTIEDHLTLLADIRIWLYDYRKYVEELIKSKKIKNPEFEIWAMQDQNFPNVSEDEFMKWIKEYGSSFEKAWDGGARELVTFLGTLDPSKEVH